MDKTAEVMILERRLALAEERNNELKQRLHSLSNERIRSIDDATEREWTLASELYYVRKDNEALRELVNEFRKVVH